jgi:hypothetical protein
VFYRWGIDVAESPKYIKEITDEVEKLSMEKARLHCRDPDNLHFGGTTLLMSLKNGMQQGKHAD